MQLKPGIGDLLWMLAGAALLGAVMLLVLRFHEREDSAAELALKAKRIDLEAEMRLDLAAESEAEKSAVMAVTDEDSQRFADEARRASAAVAAQRDELAQSVTVHGEKVLLQQFSNEFAELRRIDDEILMLAVKNTNLKAARLAFGPAADSIAQMEAALAHVAERHAAAAEGSKVAVLALDARAAALRIETLIPPHIAEENDAKMDAIEKRMAEFASQVKRDLDDLAAIGALRADPDLAVAAKRFAEFGDLEKQILSLSRENTNVRSLAISLDKKRRAMFACQESLDALQQAMWKEPVAGVDYARPSNPRGLGAEAQREH